MKLKQMYAAVMVVMLFGLIFTVQAQAEDIIVLPDPNTIITAPTHPYGTPIWNPLTGDWERVATLHDDFYGYSGKLNDVLYPDDGYDRAVGTGTLDLLIYTGAGTKDRNQDIGPFGTADFEDPMSAPTGSVKDRFSGYWGRNDQPNGPVLVDDMLVYLQSFDPNNSIPIFIFDMNQQGTEGKDDDPNWNVCLAGEVFLWDPSANSGAGARVPGAYWAFDNILNNQFDTPDPDDLPDYPFDPTNPWVTAIGPLQVGPYFVDHNKGSGKLDFIGYAPTMNLNNSAWLDKGYYFVANFHLANLNDGFEELFITGAYAPPVIPEPTSLSLFGLGLLGLLGLKKKKAA